MRMESICGDVHLLSLSLSLSLALSLTHTHTHYVGVGSICRDVQTHSNTHTHTHKGDGAFGMHFVCGKCGTAATSALLDGGRFSEQLAEGDKIDCSLARAELVII